MLAYMNQESFEATLHSGLMTYYSRSRRSLWLKGETSGHYQYVKSLSWTATTIPCWQRSIRSGAACHTGVQLLFLPDAGQKKVSGDESSEGI